MKIYLYLSLGIFLYSCEPKQELIPEHFRHVDHMVWVVEDIDSTIWHWRNLGFYEIHEPEDANVSFKKSGSSFSFRTATANLGGAYVIWIEPGTHHSIFSEFQREYGDGAMSLVHNLQDSQKFNKEIDRLSNLGIDILDEVSLSIHGKKMDYVFMDTREKGKYVLGFIKGGESEILFEGLGKDNLHEMVINQYAFAISDPGPVSDFWKMIGQPEFQINHPELGNMHYFGEPTDHSLIQGWQRHGDVSFEWCIPVKLPIVYDDHIKSHGEGIHHLAFTVNDMNKVLEDYEAKGYVNSMGGTWGEKNMPGSGRYEYIDLENAGGLTMELLWNYK